MKMREQYKRKLLVEGKDDQHVVWSLCQYHEIDDSFDLM